MAEISIVPNINRHIRKNTNRSPPHQCHSCQIRDPLTLIILRILLLLSSFLLLLFVHVRELHIIDVNLRKNGRSERELARGEKRI